MEFIFNQARHSKTILSLGAAETLLQEVGEATTRASSEPDPGVIVGSDGHALIDRFIEAVSLHRYWQRDMFQPPV